MTVGARWPGFRFGAGKKDNAILVPSNDLIVSSRAVAVAGSTKASAATRTATLRPMAREYPASDRGIAVVPRRRGVSERPDAGGPAERSSTPSPTAEATRLIEPDGR